MKPDWKDAPEWAEWLAQDGDGVWYWYENEPAPFDSSETWDSEGGMKVAKRPDGNEWRETLEQRPKQDKHS